MGETADRAGRVSVSVRSGCTRVVTLAAGRGAAMAGQQELRSRVLSHFSF